MRITIHLSEEAATSVLVDGKWLTAGDDAEGKLEPAIVDIVRAQGDPPTVGGLSLPGGSWIEIDRDWTSGRLPTESDPRR